MSTSDMAGIREAFVPRRGSSSSHAEAFDQEPRRRPTTSICRRGKGRYEDSGPSVHGEVGSSTGHGEVGPSSPAPAE
ncbi:hypothetical protein DEO72_LG10g2958 [Vigna unguiculata]|uniref:Uncharacterized protein n=1 Tax=Vigna unguiculata TaxID=3917 RepID=A0A4D6NFN1_VIGUN|nr:hypothetical protein DEO72_LG10g2958 [Vigna unguiculata]